MLICQKRVYSNHSPSLRVVIERLTYWGGVHEEFELKGVAYRVKACILKLYIIIKNKVMILA